MEKDGVGENGESQRRKHRRSPACQLARAREQGWVQRNDMQFPRRHCPLRPPEHQQHSDYEPKVSR